VPGSALHRGCSRLTWQNPGPVEVTSFILGIVGTVTGIGALVWQVITWKRSGPVVTVTAMQALPTYGDRVGDPLTCVTARNSGRAPVTVSSWGLRFPDGQVMFIRQAFAGSDALPYRLEAGASGSWSVETTAVAETCKAHGVDYADLTAYVNLANGQSVDAKRKGIQLGPGYPWSSVTTQSGL
jgi:hypothetical protein